MTENEAPLILTVELDAPAQGWAEAMRRRHFPPARNLIPAHVTLFHALPADLEGTIRAWDLTTRATPAVSIAAPFSLGRGVAYRLVCPDLVALRADCLTRLPSERLMAQDRAPWRPHLTIQNKAQPDDARKLLAELLPGHVPIETHAAALRLWRYLGGPWQPLARMAFAQQQQPG